LSVIGLPHNKHLLMVRIVRVQAGIAKRQAVIIEIKEKQRLVMIFAYVTMQPFINFKYVINHDRRND